VHVVDPTTPFIEPGWQSLHAPFPAPTEYVPRPQESHIDLPSPLDFPFAHSLQEVSPAKAINFPSAQLVHTLSPTLGEYVPPIQLVHSENPCKDIFPAGQSKQDKLPGRIEYFPKAQSKHTDTVVPPELGLVFPGGHLVQPELPGPEYEPDWQTEQLELDLPPVLGVKVPALHNAQADDPLALTYLPTGQAKHDEFPKLEYVPAKQGAVPTPLHNDSCWTGPELVQGVELSICPLYTEW